MKNTKFKIATITVILEVFVIIMAVIITLLTDKDMTTLILGTFGAMDVTIGAYFVANVQNQKDISKNYIKDLDK